VSVARLHRPAQLPDGNARIRLHPQCLSAVAAHCCDGVLQLGILGIRRERVLGPAGEKGGVPWWAGRRRATDTQDCLDDVVRRGVRRQSPLRAFQQRRRDVFLYLFASSAFSLACTSPIAWGPHIRACGPCCWLGDGQGPWRPSSSLLAVQDAVLPLICSTDVFDILCLSRRPVGRILERRLGSPRQ